VLPGVLLTALLVAGCTDDEPTAGSPSSPPSASATSSGAAPPGAPDGEDTAGDGAADAPPFPADTSPDTAEPSDDALVTVTDIRIGRHDGFDRFVLEVDGQGAPGWEVRYVDEARSQGSGDAVAVEGNALLEVTLSGVGYPYDTGVEEFPAGEAVSVAATEVVTEVVFDATFEGTTVAFVGTTDRAPFRVYLLEDPARVVIEVAHPR